MRPAEETAFQVTGRAGTAGILVFVFLSVAISLWTGPAIAEPKAANQGPKTPSKKTIPYRWALGLSNSEGGFWAKEIGWVRQDVQLRVWAGLRLCRVVEIQAGFDESLERFLMGFRFSGRYLPWGQGPYAKLDLALRFSAAGPQVGLGTGLGFSWAFHIPIGLFIEAEVLGWLNEPRALSISAVGGLFVTFGN